MINHHQFSVTKKPKNLRERANAPKPMVLMCKRTGDLFEAYRVTFLDKEIDDSYMLAMEFRLVWADYQGWIIVLPTKISPFPVFINKHGEKWFEVLGEL